MISFQLESWESFRSDPAAPGLWLEELAELPESERKHGLEPRHELFLALDAAGGLVVMTARKNGALIGYCVVSISQHPHFPIFCGFEDTFFLTKSERGAMTGPALAQAMRVELARRGVKKVYWMAPSGSKVTVLYERLGFSPVSTMYVDELEN